MCSPNVFLQCFAVVVVCLFGAVVVVSSDDMCEPALNKLVDMGVATADIKDQLPNVGTTVCDGGPCCLPSLSDPMQSRGRHLIHATMHAMATELLEKVTAARDSFKVSIEAAIQTSEESVLQSFRRSYPRLYGHAKEPIRQLYAAFRASMTDTDETMMDRALNTFWSDLFPLVYHNAIHSKLEPFTHGYMECLRKSRSSHNIRPWKFVPEQIGDPLIKGLETSRLMLHALNVGSDVILKARMYEVPEECGAPSARLYFCSSCHASMVPPCSGLCLNVARGCLAPLAELDGAWNDLGNAIARVADSVRKSGLADILMELPEILSDAIMYAMQSGSKLQKQVHTECGAHSYETSAEWETKTREGLDLRHSEGPILPGVSSPISHSTLIQSLADESVLVVAVDFWTKIADVACASMATQDTNCWNGKNVAQYSRPAAGVGVSAQKYNPEVQIARPDTSVYALADQLREVKRIVTRRLSWLPESDSFKRDEPETMAEAGILEGSGDGGSFYENDRLHGERPSSTFDDEDGSEGGSGAGPISRIDYSNNANQPKKVSGNMATQHASHTSSSSLLTGVSMVVLLFFKCVIE